MTDDQEQHVLEAYEPFLLGIVSVFRNKVPDSLCGYEDLYAEAAAAFLLEVRKLDDPHDIVKRKRAIQKAVTRFVIQNYAVSVPYRTVYYMDAAAGMYQNAASLDEMIEKDALPASWEDPLEDVLAEAVEAAAVKQLTCIHKSILNLMKEGRGRAEIARILNLSPRQIRRRIEELRDALRDAYMA